MVGGTGSGTTVVATLTQTTDTGECKQLGSQSNVKEVGSAAHLAPVLVLKEVTDLQAQQTDQHSRRKRHTHTSTRTRRANSVIAKQTHRTEVVAEHRVTPLARLLDALAQTTGGTNTLFDSMTVDLVLQPRVRLAFVLDGVMTASSRKNGK